MNMKENILIDIANKRVPTQFTPYDLMRQAVIGEEDRFKIGNKTYAKSSILTNLNNLRIGPNGELGNHVRDKGCEPQFRKDNNGFFTAI